MFSFAFGVLFVVTGVSLNKNLGFSRVRDIVARIVWTAAILCCLLPFGLCQEKIGPLRPSSLRCEYLIEPMGVDVRQPRFSWVLEHSERGQKQSAYQLVVSNSADVRIGDQWDTGKVESDESTQVAYKGKPLVSDQTYYWKVRYWDKNGNMSSYSEKSRFDTALFSAHEWMGTWIGGKNQLRKEFTLNGPVRRARVYISGLGYYELRLNGKKVGDHVLDPAWTTYDKRVLYATYDVTNLLQPGSNALGVVLGQGWYGSRPVSLDDLPDASAYSLASVFENLITRKLHRILQEARSVTPPVLLVQMNVEFNDGHRLTVVSDSTWKERDGPITSDSVYDGEVYDARRETQGWDQSGFDDQGWSAVELAKAPTGVLSAQMMAPIRVVDTIVPRSMTNPQPGVYVFDLGQNISGWMHLTVKGSRATVVRLRHSEVLYDNGMLNTENLRTVKAQDVYILNGEGEETYEPHFTYHGFRYVELTGFPGVPTLDSLRGKVVHSAVSLVGSFACSRPILNDLQRLVMWTQQDNLYGVPTDCPQRDERMGWLDDAHLTAEEAMLNFDMAAFYSNFIRDIRDVQDNSGRIPDTVPHVYGLRPADPTAGAGYPLLCWYMYENYGDRRILEENYDGLKKYVTSLQSTAEEDILKYFSFADFLAIDRVPGSLVSTFYYYYDVDLLAKIAKVLGKEDDATSYRQLADRIKNAFNNHFYNPKSQNYADGQETANTLALYLNLVPESERGAVSTNLTNDILYARNTHLTTGAVGAKYLMEVLSRIGRPDMAYELATQTTYPSWGYMIANGATTLWELWQNKTGPSYNSHNHPELGSVGAWFYRALAGINLDQEAPGYKKIHITPQVVRDLSYASASVDTFRGTVASSWVRSEKDKTFQLEVTIPVNSEAEIRVPKFNWSNIVIKESGNPVWQGGRFQSGVPGLTGATEDGEAIVFKAGSGRYLLAAIGE